MTNPWSPHGRCGPPPPPPPALAFTRAAVVAGMLALVTALALVPVAGCRGDLGPDGGAEPVHVLAAASLTNVLESLQPALESAAGGPVVLAFAASSTLARQVAAGAACDIFLSADTAWVDELAGRGLVAERRTLPPNAMVVIVSRAGRAADAAAGDPLGQLRLPATRRIAIADPGAVPAGRHARRALEHAGAWDELVPRLVSAANVRQALAWVASGDADAGIVYATDAAISDRVTLVGLLDVPPGHPVRGAAALTPRGADRAATRRVWDALDAAAARAAFTHFGFGPPPGVAAPGADA